MVTYLRRKNAGKVWIINMEEKKKYFNPKIEVIMIEQSDVITTSPDPGGETPGVITSE